MTAEQEPVTLTEDETYLVESAGTLEEAIENVEAILTARRAEWMAEHDADVTDAALVVVAVRPESVTCGVGEGVGLRISGRMGRSR